MRLATNYAEPGGWYYEFCTLDPLKATECIYPDVGCVHQGYNVKAERKVDGRTVTLTEPEAQAETLTRATAFLGGELARSVPMWEGARIQNERKTRAAMKQRALEEKILAEERAKLLVVP